MNYHIKWLNLTNSPCYLNKSPTIQTSQPSSHYPKINSKDFYRFPSMFFRMFKRLLDPKAEKRPVSVLEVNKYLEDRWLAKLGAEKAMNGNNRTKLKTRPAPPYPLDWTGTFAQVAPTRGTSCALRCTASTVPWRRRTSYFTLWPRTVSRPRSTGRRRRIVSGNGSKRARSSRSTKRTSRIWTRIYASTRTRTRNRVPWREDTSRRRVRSPKTNRRGTDTERTRRRRGRGNPSNLPREKFRSPLR